MNVDRPAASMAHSVRRCPTQSALPDLKVSATVSSNSGANPMPRRTDCRVRAERPYDRCFTDETDALLSRHG
jgi:hypothetical protein